METITQKLAFVDEDNDCLATAIQKFVDDFRILNGTANNILMQLESSLQAKPFGWPSDRTFRKHLLDIKSNLEKRGIVVEISSRRTSQGWTYLIRRMKSLSSQQELSSPPKRPPVLPNDDSIKNKPIAAIEYGAMSTIVQKMLDAVSHSEELETAISNQWALLNDPGFVMPLRLPQGEFNKLHVRFIDYRAEMLRRLSYINTVMEEMAQHERPINRQQPEYTEEYKAWLEANKDAWWMEPSSTESNQ